MADVREEMLLLLMLFRRGRRRWRKRQMEELPKRCWVREIFKRRKAQGDYHNVVQELKLGD